MRVTLKSNAVCISISLFSDVLNCKKVGVCKMLTFVARNAVRIARERERGGDMFQGQELYTVKIWRQICCRVRSH